MYRWKRNTIKLLKSRAMEESSVTFTETKIGSKVAIFRVYCFHFSCFQFSRSFFMFNFTMGASKSVKEMMSGKTQCLADGT